MSLLVDGMENNGNKNEKSFRKEIIGVMQDVRDTGRYVRSVTVNGYEIALSDVATHNFSLQDEVSVVTCSLDELIEDTITSAKEYTPKLLAAFTESGKLLRTGNIGEAAGVFSETLRGVQWTYDVLRDLAGLHPGPSPVHELFEQSEVVIPQLFEAWETQDFVLVADVLEYELLPLLERWLYVTELFASQMQAERLKQGIYQQ